MQVIKTYLQFCEFIDQSSQYKNKCINYDKLFLKQLQACKQYDQSPKQQNKYNKIIQESNNPRQQAQTFSPNHLQKQESIYQNTMKQHSFHNNLNLSTSIYDHRDYIFNSSHNLVHQYPPSAPKSHLAPSHSSYLQIHSNRIISALKRDRLKTHNDQLSKYMNNSTLFPQSGMSHKRYIADIESKLLTSATKPDEYSLNHSAILYLYSFTEYERMKEKMQERSRAEDHWLESELKRMKREDQIIQAKEKMRKRYETPYLPLKIQNKKKVKEIFNEVREQLKQTNTKLDGSMLSDHKKKNNEQQNSNHSFVQQLPKSPIIKSKKFSTSQVMSPETKSKKSQRLQKHKKSALKQMLSRHLPINNSPQQPTTKNHRKSQPRDRYRYVSDSGSGMQNSSMFKSQYFNRYDYVLEKERKNNKKEDRVKGAEDGRVTDEMIDRAFVFDEMGECESEYEEDEGDEKKNMNKGKEVGNKKNSGYRDCQDVVYEKLFRTPERQKNEASFQANNSSKQSNKSSTKQQRHRYNDLLVSIERKKLQSKHFDKSQLHTSQKHILSTSPTPGSPQQQQFATQKFINQSKPYQKFNSSHTNMKIQNNNSDHYPVFSPYSQHKHLPNEYLTASLERKKLPKLNGALTGVRREQEMRQQQVGLKDLIVDEIEKRKIASRKEQWEKGMKDADKQEISKHQKKEIIATVEKQRQQHSAIQPSHSNNTSTIHPEPHPTHTSQCHSHPSSQIIAKTLKIQLQILKQQLEDKNRKVVDLQLQLMQIKSSLNQKRQEKEDEATTTKSRLPNEDSRKDVIMMMDGECQTESKNQLEFFSGIFDQVVMPDDTKTKQQRQELFRTKNHVKILQSNLNTQQQAMNNLFEDLGMYIKLNDELQNKIKLLEKEKSQRNS